MILSIIITSLLVLGAGGFCMAAYTNRYKKQRRWIISATIIALLLVISIPFLINELYKTNLGYETLWNANDVLSFYGAFIAFLGTVLLGALALWQNFKFKKANDEKDMLF